jgi:hypothetical protein
LDEEKNTNQVDMQNPARTSVSWFRLFLGLITAVVLGTTVAYVGPLIGGGIAVILCGMVLGLLYFSSSLPASLVNNIKFTAIVLLVSILPFENTLNLLVGFSLKPLAIIPFFFCIDSAMRTLVSGKHRIPKMFEFAATTLIIWAILYIPMTLLLPVPPLQALMGGLLGFFIQFRALFYYFAVRSISLDSRQTQRLLQVILVTLFVLTAYGVYEYMFDRYGLADYLLEHSQHPAISEYDMARGLRYQQYTIGTYRSMSFSLEFVTFGYSGFVLSSIFFALLLINPHWRKRIRLWILLIVAVLGLLSSQTISAIGSFLMSCALVWGIWKQKVKLYYGIAVLVVIVIIGFIASRSLPEVVDRMVDIVKGDDLQARWHHAYNARFFREEFSKYVLLGYGTGVAGPTEAKYFHGYGVEHEYFANAIQWGWPGLLIYILFMLSLLRRTWVSRFRFPKCSVRYALSVGLFAVAVGYTLIGFYHNVWGQSSVDVQFLVLLAMLTSGDWSRIEAKGNVRAQYVHTAPSSLSE